MSYEPTRVTDLEKSKFIVDWLKDLDQSIAYLAERAKVLSDRLSDIMISKPDDVNYSAPSPTPDFELAKKIEANITISRNTAIILDDIIDRLRL